MDWLRSQRPDLVERYEELYRRGAYAPKEERERLSRLVRRGPGAREGLQTRAARGRPSSRRARRHYEARSRQQTLF